jgi:hypothetical protein
LFELGKGWRVDARGELREGGEFVFFAGCFDARDVKRLDGFEGSDRIMLFHWVEKRGLGNPRYSRPGGRRYISDGYIFMSSGT